jgi:hypothetical protein
VRAPETGLSDEQRYLLELDHLNRSIEYAGGDLGLSRTPPRVDGSVIHPTFSALSARASRRMC